MKISSPAPAQPQAANDVEPSGSDSALSTSTFSACGELFDAAQPKTQAQNVLVAGYWLQVIQKAGDLTGHAVNAELKHIGHRASNITNSFSELIRERPALAIQTRKSGRSQQSKKKYKLTDAGIKAVEAMLNKSD